MDAERPPVAMTRRIVTSVVVIVLTFVAAGYGFRKLAGLRKQSERSAATTPAPLVRAEEAHRGPYQEVLRGFGRAEALKRTQVVAEVEGVVREIAPQLEAGSAIAAEGPEMPVLVRLDDRDLRDRVARAEAELAVADAEISRIRTNKRSLGERLGVAEEELETATRELRRVQGLVPATLSQSDLDAQRIQVTARRNQVVVVEAMIAENGESLVAAQASRLSHARALDLARRELERATVRAPYPGRIVSRDVNLGAKVRAGDPLFTIVDLSRVEVPIALPARRFDEVRPGATASARLPGASELLWSGQIDRVAPTINADDRTFFAYVVIDGSPVANVAAPGAHLLVEVHGRRHEDVIAVPRRAFLGEKLFVARPDGDEAVIRVRLPRVSRLLSGEALVTDGLEDGELFLVTNLESVAEGSRVRLAPAREPDAGPR